MGVINLEVKSLRVYNDTGFIIERNKHAFLYILACMYECFKLF